MPQLSVPLNFHCTFAFTTCKLNGSQTKREIKNKINKFDLFLCSFFALLVVYLVAGILFNKYHKGATGKEVIPNVNFWTDFPLLVKVGMYKLTVKNCVLTWPWLINVQSSTLANSNFVIPITRTGQFETKLTVQDTN